MTIVLVDVDTRDGLGPEWMALEDVRFYAGEGVKLLASAQLIRGRTVTAEALRESARLVVAWHSFQLTVMETRVLLSDAGWPSLSFGGVRVGVVSEADRRVLVD